MSSDRDVFVPPAPYPGTTDLGMLKRLARAASSQIASLPRDVYEKSAWTPPLPGMPLFITAPDLIKTVLLDEAENFPHGDLFERIMRPAWGTGLLLATGDDWKLQRRAAAQAFRASGMADFVPVFASEAQKLVDLWAGRGFGTVDLHEEMKRLTFNIIVETMLSGADQIDRDGFRHSVQSFFADIAKLRLSYVMRSDRYHGHRPSLPSSHRPGIIAHMQKLVEQRRSTPPRGDMVDLLLAAEDPETGRPLSDVQLADNLLGFILAGYETTAAALTWTLYLIAANEPTEQALLDAFEVEPSNAPAGNLLARQIISEALRLYPPAFLLTRVAARDTMIGGSKVKSGQRINIPIWAIHRSERFWPRPNVFDPARFAPDRPAPERYTYMPFGAGPRICIGAAFATTEIATVLQTILPQVKIRPPPRERVWPKTELALVPHEKMMVEISPR